MSASDPFASTGSNSPGAGAVAGIPSLPLMDPSAVSQTLVVAETGRKIEMPDKGWAPPPNEDINAVLTVTTGPEWHHPRYSHYLSHL